METELKTTKMKKSINTLAIAITAMIISLPNVMAEEPSTLSMLDLEVLTEVAIEDAVVLEEWMIATPKIEKAIELDDWMLDPAYWDDANCLTVEKQHENWTICVSIRPYTIETILADALVPDLEPELED